MEEQKYRIGNKVYTQRKLVLGQIQQMIGLFKGVKMPEEFTSSQLLLSLGDRITDFLAIVVTEEGKSPKEKDLAAAAKELFDADPETVAEVIDHFFVLNSAKDLLQRFAGIFIKAVKMAGGPTGSPRPSSSSPEETLPSETKSSGDLHPENALPTSRTAPGD